MKLQWGFKRRQQEAEKAWTLWREPISPADALSSGGYDRERQAFMGGFHRGVIAATRDEAPHSKRPVE